MTHRPSVSVIVPFAGTGLELERLLTELGRLALGLADELIIADNRLEPHSSPEPDILPKPTSRIRIHPAGGTRTPGFARNQGAKLAGEDWLVFIDADTRPSPALLDAYFDPAPGASTALLAGAIEDLAPRPSLAARYGVVRRHMSQRTTLERGRWSYAQSANCAVRREAFATVGGFAAEARAGEDADFCFRLRAAGWELEERPRATVGHIGRETVPALLGQLARHGSGSAWCEGRHPGSFPRPATRELLRRMAHSAREAAAAAARGERESSVFAVLDLLGAAAFELGRLLPNESAPRFPRSNRG